MKKIFNVFAITIISAIIAGIYGILHDQLTYTISPEYYTKFKFIQFALTEERVPIKYPRFYVAVTGWMATWWVGLIIGFILSLFTLFQKENIYKTTLKAIVVVLLVAFITGLAGLICGYTFVSDLFSPMEWYYPENVIDKKSFTAVGTMHNFSYTGGLMGLVVGILYIQRYKKSIIKK